MLGAEGLFVTGQRPLRQFQTRGRTAPGDQGESQLATLTVRLRVVVAEAPQRPPEQILSREDGLRPFVLVVQRGLERLPVDDP